MANARFCTLDDRGILALQGDDIVHFLQGIVTNDVEALSDDRAIYAALLTPQGKYLHDFFLVQLGETVLLEAAKTRLNDLKRRLTMYRLRAKVTIEDVSDDWAVFALFGGGAYEAASLNGEAGLACRRNDGAVLIDPRLRALGVRAILPRAVGAALLSDGGFTAVPRAEYDEHHHRLGVADELEAEALYPLEAGFDELNGISFTKGCYVGQEVTARMKNRQLVRKRIVPVMIDGDAVEEGGKVLLGDAVVGEILADGPETGLALIRVESLQTAMDEGKVLTSGGATLRPNKPDWAEF
jgi:folate-binding protein YgfZ